MRRAIKKMLHRAGVLAPAERLYFNLRTANVSVLRRELAYMRGASPDGQPLPPPSLVFDIIACRWRAVYLDSGERIVGDLVDTLRRNDVDPGRFEAVLDFGCGCGRLIRQMRKHTNARLNGSDYNPELVAWCRDNLTFADFAVNDLAPPLTFADASFDFVYARSVFTHLDANLQEAWIREMRRVLRPEALLYVTMHGDRLAGGLTQTQRQRYEAGELVVTYATFAGQNLCSTFANRSWVTRAFSPLFDLVAFEPGRDTDHLRQDVYLLRARGS